MKFFHDYDEPSRAFTAREHDLIARLLKAEADETIRRRNLDRRWRDMPEEFQGAIPIKYGEKCKKKEQPKAPRPSAKDARAREADRAVLESLLDGPAYVAELARKMGRSQWSVYEATMRLNRAGHVIYALEKLVTESNAAYRKLWSITGKGRNAIASVIGSPPAPVEPSDVSSATQEPKAAVAQNPEPLPKPRKVGITMPRAPWQREAAE